MDIVLMNNLVLNVIKNLIIWKILNLIFVFQKKIKFELLFDEKIKF